MRLNKFIASASDLSRRAADDAIAQGRVTVDGRQPSAGEQVSGNEDIRLDGIRLHAPAKTHTLLLNKPRGYVVSRNGQGSRTVFELLPPEFQQLQAVGRLDKESSGLLLLTNDGNLAQQLTHPSHQKIKRYEVTLDQPLAPLHRQMISEFGVQLDDGPSKLGLERLEEGNDRSWVVTMHEGRNRQIRRTFKALGYHVTALHRTTFGNYQLPLNLASGAYISVDMPS